MSAFRVLRRQLLRGSVAVVLLIAGGVAGPGLASAQQEAPTAETEIIVNVSDAGTLDVAWASRDVAFLADGSSPTLDATNTTAHITTTLSFTIADTRSDGNRPGYTIVLHASDLTTGSGATIPASSLMVEAVTGVPSGATGVTPGSTLAGPTTIVTVANGSAAVNGTIDIVVGTTLGPETSAGTYSGAFTFDVLPTTNTLP